MDLGSFVDIFVCGEQRYCCLKNEERFCILSVQDDERDLHSTASNLNAIPGAFSATTKQHWPLIRSTFAHACNLQTPISTATPNPSTPASFVLESLNQHPTTTATRTVSIHRQLLHARRTKLTSPASTGLVSALGTANSISANESEARSQLEERDWTVKGWHWPTAISNVTLLVENRRSLPQLVASRIGLCLPQPWGFRKFAGRASGIACTHAQ
jgi:hypothetical protein